MALFACATVNETVNRELEVESAHERHHMAKGRGQSSSHCQRSKGQGHSGLRQKRMWIDSCVIVYAVEGQIQRFP